MKRPPFKMLPARGAVLTCDGKFVVGGRASFAWETYLLRRASGVPGNYKIRHANYGVDAATGQGPWHKLDWSVDEAERALSEWGNVPGFSDRRVEACKRRRVARVERGLPVG